MRTTIAALVFSLAGCVATGVDDVRSFPGDSGTADAREEVLAPSSSDVYVEGVRAFRAPGKHGSCAGCHAPDALDLAAVAYSDEDVRRRARGDDLSPSDAEKVVALVHHLRARLPLPPVDPRTFRPFQPGKGVLWAGTETRDPHDLLAMEARDLAFGEHLRDVRKLLLSRAPIDGLARAKSAASELLAIDLRDLEIGIPFDRWSQDPHHGDLGVDEWVPALASSPRPGREAAWWSAVDRYLAEPTEANLFAFYDRIEELTEIDPRSRGGDPHAEAFMRAKWRSLLVAQHALYRAPSRALPDPWRGLPNPAHEPPTTSSRNRAIERSPFWSVGDLVRKHPLDPRDAAAMKLPPFVTIPSSPEVLWVQGHRIQQSWFWSAWMFDPALVASADSLSTTDCDYFCATLLNRYKLHLAFFVAKAAVEKANAGAWFSSPALDREPRIANHVAGHGKWASSRTFLVLRQLRHARPSVHPSDPRFALNVRMLTNFARMLLYLVDDDLRATRTVWDRAAVVADARNLRSWFADPALAPHGAGVDALVASIEMHAQAAKELR